MRTTVNIDNELLEQAKTLAYTRRQSLGDVISDGLRLLVYPNPPAKANRTVKLITFKGKGTCPGVDLDSNAALLDVMEGR